VDLLASIPELEARLGRTIDENEMDRALALLEDASGLVRVEVGDTVWTDPDTGLTVLSLVPVPVRTVALRAAERAMRNPGGYSSESSGDYSFQRNAVQGSGVYLTDNDLKILRRAVRRNSGLWTQPVTRGDVFFDTVWLEDNYGCELIPYDVYREP
jgi:hypothetical protein